MDFIESNMLMSFDEHNAYRIEKSDIVSRQEEIKACEYFALNNGRMFLIEAKSSSPKPTSKEYFDKYIDEITQKFVDTLLLFNALSIGRYGDNERNKLPINIQYVTLGNINYAFYLIIHGHKIDWMPPIQEALKLKLKHYLKLWNIPDINVYAINHEEAKRRGLIDKYLPLDVLYDFKNKGLQDNVLQQAVEQWLINN